MVIPYPAFATSPGVGKPIYLPALTGGTSCVIEDHARFTVNAPSKMGPIHRVQRQEKLDMQNITVSDVRAVIEQRVDAEMKVLEAKGLYRAGIERDRYNMLMGKIKKRPLGDL